MLKEKCYERKNWKGVIHTTWNPKGPGVIRLHMIPPKFSWIKHEPALVIVNGMEIVPLYESWAILFTALVNRINEFDGVEIGEEDMEQILAGTIHEVRAVYGNVKEEVLLNDLYLMTDTFEKIARGENPEIEIEALSIGQYAPNMTAPHRMDLMISAMEKEGHWNCNQKCVHCYAAGEPQGKVGELTTEEWKTIIARCRKEKICQLTFTGGEPTLRSDLVELVEASKWFVTRLNTNGILMTEPLAKELYDASLDSVQVTFYSANKEIHNELVGGDHFDQTVAGIRNALKAGLNVSVNTPLCSLNRDYVETLRFLKDLGVTYVTCSGLIVTGNARTDGSKKLQLTSAEMEELLANASDYVFAHGMEMDFTSPGWVTEEFLRAHKINVPSCGACLSNMAIAPDGTVVPCQSWLKDEGLGNMLRDKWKTIWNHKTCVERRKFSAKMLQKCPLRGETDKEMEN